MKTKSQLGLGTAAIGRPSYINIKSEESEITSLEAFKAKGLKILSRAYELGIRHFDTAPGYGMAEELILSWISEKKYADVEISTKWGYTYVANFDPQASVHEVKDHSISKLIEQWGFSQALMPYLKLYQIHSATLQTGVLTNEKVLNQLAEIKALHNIEIGISCSGDNQVEVIKKALDVEIESVALFDSFQVTFNIFEQSLLDVEHLLETAGKKIIIKEALANGRVFPNNRFSDYKPAYDKLVKLSGKYDVGIDAIALNFCLESLNSAKVLSGASEILHLEENYKAVALNLESEDIADLGSFGVDAGHYWNERKKLTWN